MILAGRCGPALQRTHPHAQQADAARQVYPLQAQPGGQADGGRVCRGQREGHVARDGLEILKAQLDAVLEVVKKAKAANLENVELFDVFRGKNVPAGQKSVAYAFTYRAADKTLTDAEVNAAHDKLVADFKQKLQATLRE